MKRQALLLGAVLCASTPWAYPANSIAALHVSKGGRSIILIGSQHTGRPEPGRAETVEPLVAESNAVCMEADPRDPQTAATGAQLLTNPTGVQLRDRLRPATYASARQHLAWMPEIAANIDKLSPFALATLLTFKIPALRNQAAGMSPASSLDADILQAAQRYGKPIVALERNDALRLSHSRVPDREWDAYVAGIIDIIDCEPCARDYGTNMAAALAQQGDYEEVSRSLARAFASHPAIGKTYNEIYFGQRNDDMADAIAREAIARQRCSLVAIGIGHLGGEHGVVALLRRAGFTVKPLPPATAGRGSARQ